MSKLMFIHLKIIFDNRHLGNYKKFKILLIVLLILISFIIILFVSNGSILNLFGFGLPRLNFILFNQKFN